MNHNNQIAQLRIKLFSFSLLFCWTFCKLNSGNYDRFKINKEPSLNICHTHKTFAFQSTSNITKINIHFGNDIKKKKKHGKLKQFSHIKKLPAIQHLFRLHLLYLFCLFAGYSWHLHSVSILSKYNNVWHHATNRSGREFH